MFKQKATATLKTIVLIVIVAIGSYSGTASAQQNLLWQIGGKQNKFALAPDQYSKFSKDGFFIVGKSSEQMDWPYCHPGPDDGWAGNRKHTFTVVFGLKNASSKSDAVFTVQLADVGRRSIKLLVTVNNNKHTVTVPRGASKAISGDTTGGKKYTFTVTIPSTEFIAGNNIISLTTESGSWMVYDNLRLTAPAEITAQAVTPNITVAEATGLPFIQTKNNRSYQPVKLMLTNTGDQANLTAKLSRRLSQNIVVPTGYQQADILAPEVTKDSVISITLKKGGKVLLTQKVTVKPVTKMTIYVLPHSHTDIGYTEIQSAVEEKQINNLLTGIEYAEKTKNYPEGARFVWNVEGTYVADLFLQRMSEDKKAAFYNAVKNGSVALNGMYVNTLTGLCRPEELINLFKYSTELGNKCNVTIDAAMLSDVPGNTWGTVAAMARAGIKYFSNAPNNFDRIGDILVKWENKPFYWVSPSGKEKVLVWIPYRGYALSHGVSALNADFVSNYVGKLKEINFPYDISYIRWAGHGDNAVPDIEISDFVKDWSSKYTWPKFIITSTSKAFKTFEDKYGSTLPVEKGDWTGYWEDGAGSSSFETAQNRASSERLTQAETVWSMANSSKYPTADFENGWKHVSLYSEHTWGADISVSTPLSQKTIEQWEIKKSYATAADSISKVLLHRAYSGRGAQNTIDVLNTNSWAKTGLVIVSAQQSANGDVVKDAAGNVFPSQRLSTGELAFVAKDIAPFAAKRFTINNGVGFDATKVLATDNILDNGLIRVVVDKTSGAITSLRCMAIDNNFADSANGNYLNDFLFLRGNDVATIKRNGPVTIKVKESGPVMAVLSVQSEAPGANKLTREIRLVAGADYVEVANIVDKKPAELNPVPGDYAWANVGGKESLNFGFPFNVSRGVMNIDIPFGVMQPEKDQIPGSCKNWLETNRWVDVSNDNFGITWSSLDAPLIQVGGVTANLLGGQTNPDVWRKKIDQTQTLYSWALNNHWETNYRAYQDGIITFRYAMRPHSQYDPAEATRFATALLQPLVVADATGNEQAESLLQLSSPNIIVTALKPADEGNAFIVTLFNPTDMKQQTALKWKYPVKSIVYSNTGEHILNKVADEITIDALEVVMLRVEK
ncbi:polysaccharide lyase family protein [Danxiaibacter flavus]|uniref:Polysaccharide lyase family protein n=1 Tax=Danxiaibacter flavus TaxID=3049108 RepID=A0ABV3ZFQ3_9BACT|nr:polysaccharide lyase family protein [Chitinophagaceae bacterium DXS]